MKIFGKIDSRPGGRGRIAGLVLALGLAAGPLAAQESPVYDEPEVDAVISLTVGWTQTGARNDFPSLIVGTSEVGSGVIPGSYARPGSGYGIELEGLIYFNDFIGMTLGLASTRSAARAPTVHAPAGARYAPRGSPSKAERGTDRCTRSRW